MQSSAPKGGGGGWLINHLPTILWHRRLYVIIPAVLLFVAGLATAYSLPTLYRSTATMLVESQDLPTDIVQAPGTGEIEKRIAKIREQVLSRGDLISLIEQNNLYEAERRSKPMSYVVDKMRKATTVGALAGDIGGSAPANGECHRDQHGLRLSGTREGSGRDAVLRDPVPPHGQRPDRGPGQSHGTFPQ